MLTPFVVVLLIACTLLLLGGWAGDVILASRRGNRHGFRAGVLRDWSPIDRAWEPQADPTDLLASRASDRPPASFEGDPEIRRAFGQEAGRFLEIEQIRRV
jgi:hypothetical protein